MIANDISTTGVINQISQTEKTVPVSEPAKMHNSEIDDSEKIQDRQAMEKEPNNLAKSEETPKDKLSNEDAKKLTNEMNEIMDDLQTSLGFFISEDVKNQIVVKIKDRNTNETIKQIPSEELLAIKEKMEAFTGLLFDQTV